VLALLDCPKPLIQWRGSFTHFAQEVFLGLGFDFGARHVKVSTSMRRPRRIT
jgi:hypothetical protein